MFIGHFGVALGAKVIAPRVSLGSLFLAAQLLDLLWTTFLLLGIETVRIVPGATRVTPLIFEHYPYSHSLLFAALWAVIVGGIFFAYRRSGINAFVIGALVISHWVLDIVVHQPDLHLAPGNSVALGLNAWSSLPLTLAIEVAIFTTGVWLYVKTTRPTDRLGVWSLVGLVAFLLVIYVGNLFGAPPPNAEAIAWVGQAQWLLVLLAFGVDKHRGAVRSFAL